MLSPWYDRKTLALFKNLPLHGIRTNKTRIPDFLLTSAPAGGFLACGPQLCHKFHGGGHRRGKFHYTHEAEERNKIKFLILVESFINFIHCLLSSLRFQPLLVALLN